MDGSHDPDVRLMHFVRSREGVFHRAAATRFGFSAAMIRTRCRVGVWRQLDTDVFALAAFPGTWTQRCRAATLIHPSGALSHRTAAAMRSLDGFRPGAIHVVVSPVAHHASRLAVVHRSRHLQFDQIDGIPTTTFAQTMVQLAGVAGERELRRALHSGLHQHGAHLDELHIRIGELRMRRMPGMSTLIALLDELDGQPPTESELERMLDDVTRAVPGLPCPSRQVEMPWNSDRTTVVDGFVAELGLVLEADGRRWHTRVADFESDRWRDNEAAAHGLHVMRFSWHRLRHDRAGVIDQLTRFTWQRRAAA